MVSTEGGERGGGLRGEQCFLGQPSVQTELCGLDEDASVGTAHGSPAQDRRGGL